MSATSASELPASLNLARAVACPFCPARFSRSNPRADFSGPLRIHLRSCPRLPATPPASLSVSIVSDDPSAQPVTVELAFCGRCSWYMSPRFIASHNCGGHSVYHGRTTSAAQPDATTGASPAPASPSPSTPDPSLPPSPARSASPTPSAAATVDTPPPPSPPPPPLVTSHVRPFAGRANHVLSFVPSFVTRAYINKGAEIAHAFVDSVQAGHEAHIEGAIGLLLSYPSLVLAPPRRSRWQSSLARRIGELVVDVDAAALETLARPLLDEPDLPTIRKPAESIDDDVEVPSPDHDQLRRAERCLSALSASGLSAARRALVDPPLPIVSHDILADLDTLHPNTYGFAFPSLPGNAPRMRVDLQHLRVVFLRLSHTASPGVSGWRKALLKPLLGDDVCGHAIALFIELIINGAIRNPLIRCALLSSRLIPLLKKVGARGVRPIAVGDLFVKLAAHYALDAVSHHFGSIFHPFQLGLGTRGGVETVVHACQTFIERHEDAVVLSLDFCNAFNSRSRAYIAMELYDHEEFAPLWRFFDWSYGTPALLFVFSRSHYVHHLWSREGVRQGDVLGSFLFALSIQSSLVVVAEQFPLVRPLAFHDDINLLGRPELAFEALRLLGTLLNPQPPTTPDQAPDAVPVLNLAISPTKTRLFVPRDGVDISCFSSDGELPITVVQGGAFEVLGSVIGLDSDAVSTFCRRYFTALSDELSHVASNSHVSLQLRLLFLRMCIVPAAIFLLRTVYPSRVVAAAREFDQRVLEFFAVHCLQLPSFDHLPQRCRWQAKMPLRMGGFGLRSAELVAHPAFLASVVNSRRPAIPGFNDIDWVTADFPFAAEVRAVHDYLATRVLPLPGVFPGTLPQLLDTRTAAPRQPTQTKPARPLPPLQRYMVLNLETTILASLLAGRVFPGDRGKPPYVSFKYAASTGPSLSPDSVVPQSAEERSEIRLRLGLLRCAHASLLLSAMPLTPAFTIPDATLRCAFRLRLGLIPALNDVQPQCARCDRTISETDLPFHPFSCDSRRPGQYVRHDSVRDVLGDIARSCGLRVSTHQRDLTLHRPAEPVLVADLLIARQPLSRLIDVSVVCSMAPSYRGKFRRPTGPIGQRFHAKRNKYEAAAEAAGHSFSPVVFDALGLPHKHVSELLTRVANAGCAAGQLPVAQSSSFVRASLTRLAAAVIAGNMDLVRACWPLSGHATPHFTTAAAAADR